ncbi:hypothetical protein M9458_036822, partial [Cirrhinus mrigala]
MVEQAVQGAMVEQAAQEAMTEQAFQGAVVERPPWPWPLHSAREQPADLTMERSVGLTLDWLAFLGRELEWILGLEKAGVMWILAQFSTVRGQFTGMWEHRRRWWSEPLARYVEGPGVG